MGTRPHLRRLLSRARTCGNNKITPTPLLVSPAESVDEDVANNEEAPVKAATVVSTTNNMAHTQTNIFNAYTHRIYVVRKREEALNAS